MADKHPDVLRRLSTAMPRTPFPRLETDRLILRPPSYEDWPGFADLMVSEHARFMGGPFSIQGAWGVFCHGIAQWDLFGLGALSIEQRETGAWVGQVEVNQGPCFPEPELGWQVRKEAEGRGYAFEAAMALRDWVFDKTEVTTLVSYVHPDNTRSIRLAERLGALRDPDAVVQDPGDLVFRHRRRR